MNEFDQKLHDEIHEQMMSIDPEKIFTSRIEIFKKIEKKLNVTISGKVVDIGCGNGYASIWLAKNRNVEVVFALEASNKAVTELLPRNISHHLVDDKVKPLLGSFDALPFDSEIDFVVSFGALHHSPCLFSTMKSISHSLKNGSFLIAQEPVMPSNTSNQDYIDKYNIVENRFGVKSKNGDRIDRFFRESEYMTAASFSGMDLVCYCDFIPNGVLRKIRRFCADSLNFIIPGKVGKKYKYHKYLMKKIMVFQKNDVEYIPHLWNGLK